MKMLSTEQNHIDCESNGGLSKVDSELIILRPGSGKTLLNACQLQQSDQEQQQQQLLHKSPTATVNAKQVTNTQNSDAKKSVMLNLKSGAINSTVEEFGSFSTRFSDTFTQNANRCRLWLLVVGISIGCLCFFVFGISFTYLFDKLSCDGKCFSIIFFFSFN